MHFWQECPRSEAAIFLVHLLGDPQCEHTPHAGDAASDHVMKAAPAGFLPCAAAAIPL